MGRAAGVNLTKRKIEELPPKDSTYPVPDARVRGLYLQVTPTGTKSFVMRYRIHGSQRTLTLGRFPDLSVEQARKEAEEAMGQIRKGADPTEERRVHRGIPTISELADQFLAEYCTIHLRPKSAQGYREMVEGAIRPGLGKIKTDALTHAQVARWHHDLRNTPRKANYALAVLRKMMNLAATWGFREKSNPCTGIKKFPETTRDRIPTMEELARIWETFDKAKKENWASPFALACLQVILLTGSRKTVIRTLRWDHVDMEAGFIRLPANTEGSKAKEAVSIALPPQAIEVLATLPHFLGLASKFVFPGNSPESATGCVDSLWFRIREAAEVPDLRIHDLRHLWGTTAGALNFQGPMIQASLNHKTPATTSRYVNLKDAAKKEVATAVGRALSQAKRKTAGS